jgi:hypothetical protein
MKQPWDRLTAETAKAYEHFIRYRDLGVERTILDAAHPPNKPAVNHRTLEEYSSRHNWVDRASKWDDHLVKVAQRALEKEIREMRERHRTIARAILNRVGAKLVGMTPAEMSPGDVARLASVGSEMERVAMGDDPSQRNPEVAPGSGQNYVMLPVPAANISEWMKSLNPPDDASGVPNPEDKPPS